MGMVYEAQSRAEFEWAAREWMPRPKGYSGRVEVRMAPLWWRALKALGLNPQLRFGMRVKWPN